MKLPKSVRQLFIAGNLLLAVLILAAIVRDESRPWKKYQKEFYRLEAARLQKEMDSTADPEKKRLLAAEIGSKSNPHLEIRQIIVKDLGRIDRCITCHVGMDSLTNPSLKTEYTQNPYKGHPGDILSTHSPTKYGCTVCHAGQGLATTVQAAHGAVKHWEEPILPAPFIQASCARCHANFETIPYAKDAALGKELFAKNGCYGCHSIKGWGGIIAEDLGEVASKSLARIDFSTTGLPREEWNIKNWIYLHLTRDPMTFVRGDPEGHLGSPISPSGMQPFYLELKEGEAKAITSYLLSMSGEKIPHEYYVYAPAKPEPKFAGASEHGKYVFEKFGCAACHGRDAQGNRRNFNALGPIQDKEAKDQVAEMAKGREPNLRETVGTFTREELKAKIQNGVTPDKIVKYREDGPTPPLYMPAWKEKIKGQELEDLMTYLFSIAKKGEEW